MDDRLIGGPTVPELTRKQRREQARAQRRELERAQALRAAQRVRLAQLGGAAVVVAAVVVIVLLATSGSGSRQTPTPSSPAAQQAATEVSALLEGVPQAANALGAADAPVTLRYFGDLECPVCRQFTLGALPALIDKYVRPGKLRIEYASLQTATREPDTFRAQQMAALAAGRQGKLWHYVELFYHEQGEEGSGYVTEPYLQGLAAQVPGLDLSRWSASREDRALSAELTSDAQAASQNGLESTPSFLVGRTGGALRELSYSSPTDPSSFEAAIQAAMNA